MFSMGIRSPLFVWGLSWSGGAHVVSGFSFVYMLIGPIVSALWGYIEGLGRGVLLCSKGGVRVLRALFRSDGRVSSVVACHEGGRSGGGGDMSPAMVYQRVGGVVGARVRGLGQCMSV
jgi:hypothetical protein